MGLTNLIIIFGLTNPITCLDLYQLPLNFPTNEPHLIQLTSKLIHFFYHFRINQPFSIYGLTNLLSFAD